MARLSPQAWMTSQASMAVMEALRAQGGEGRFVGGCVRDALLGRPVNDVDIACTLKPEQTMAALKQADIRAIPTGLDHGTVTALYEDGTTFEITTLRKDVHCDGRHAQVAFTDDWEEDAKRRDLTMNALYANPEGEIYDYFGGVEDAEHGRIRFIGDAVQRIEEDALRILRFFRFYAHYGSPPMDADGLAACQSRTGLLEGLSGERIQTEMFKLFKAQYPADVLAAMAEAEVLAPLGLQAGKPACAALEMLPLAEEQIGARPHALRRLALLLHAEHGKNAVDVAGKVALRWKLSNADRAALKTLAAGLPDTVTAEDVASQKQAIRRMRAGAFANRVLIAWAEALAKHPEAVSQTAQRFAPMIALAENWDIPTFPLTGQDVLQLGMKPGPEVGNLLSTLETWWEGQDYAPDKAALLSRAKQEIS